MHAMHPDAIRLAAAAAVDPRTAAKFLKGERIRTHQARRRLEEHAAKLDLRASPTDDEIDEQPSKAEALARLHGES